MPSEKLKYLGNVRPRECLFHQSWSDEEGDRSFTISRDGDRLFVRIKKEWGGNQEIELSRLDAEGMLSGLEKFVRPS